MIRPLAATISPWQDESLNSMLLRAAQVNCVDRVTLLCKHVGLPVANPASVAFAHHDKAAELAVMLGLDRFTVERRFHPRIGEDLPELIDWYGTPLLRHYAETNIRRYSPRGYWEAPYGRAAWLLRPMRYCPFNFDHLLGSCPSCGEELDWNTAVDLSNCAVCAEPLPRSVQTLSPQYRATLQVLARLLSTDPDERRSVVQSLPEPYVNWEPGEVFEAVVELGLAAVKPKVEWGDGSVRRTAHGNFELLGEAGPDLGWSVISGGRAALHALLREIVHVNDSSGGSWYWHLGMLRRHVERPTYMTKFRSLLRQELPEVLAGTQLPLRVVARSPYLRQARSGTVTMWEAHLTMGIDSARLQRLEGKGDAHIGTDCHSTSRPMRIFDRAKLGVAGRDARDAVTGQQAAKQLGVPCFMIPMFIEVGVLRGVKNRDSQILAGPRLLLDRGSVENLLSFAEGLETLDVGNDLVVLQQALRLELNPWIWALTLRDVVEGDLPAYHEVGAQTVLACIGVVREDFERVRRCRTPPIPDVEIPGHIAGSLLGLNRVVAWDIARKGLLEAGANGIRLRSLQGFRDNYVVPSEVPEWWPGKSRSFAIYMRQHGVHPASVVRKINIWRRADLERVFSESKETRFRGDRVQPDEILSLITPLPGPLRP